MINASEIHKLDLTISTYCYSLLSIITNNTGDHVFLEKLCTIFANNAVLSVIIACG